MSNFIPRSRELWAGYFDPDTQQNVDGVVQFALAAAETRNLLNCIEPDDVPMEPLDLIREMAEVAGMRFEDGFHKSQHEQLKGSHFYPEEMEVLTLALAASTIWDEMELEFGPAT